MDRVFIELVRQSIGLSKYLSYNPSADEWKELYMMAVKQSLEGVCFAGVRKYMEAAQQQGWQTTIPQKLYYKWLGITVQIWQCNELMDKRCEELQSKLSSLGFKNSILKGQGLNTLYGELKNFRKPGDIDVWIHARAEDSSGDHFKRVMEYVTMQGKIGNFNRQHVVVRFFEDVMVEVHFTPSVMNNPIHNRRLQNWFKHHTKVNYDFNIIYLVQHCYNHFLFEGIGLRQLMDYYFLLKSSVNQRKDYTELLETLEYLGLKKFAEAMMWVMKDVFYLNDEHLICLPNKKLGEYLLKEILSGGNFGHYGNAGVMKSHTKGKFSFFMARMRRNLKLFNFYPTEIIWSPYTMIKNYVWKRIILCKILLK